MMKIKVAEEWVLIWIQMTYFKCFLGGGMGGMGGSNFSRFTSGRGNGKNGQSFSFNF
jgi:hypothetical protein